jgi:predicted neutral ceramidase superfamily lipid hydrolase
VDNRGTALLARLGRLNRTAVFLAAVVVVFAALLLPGFIGSAFLLGIAFALAGLLILTWSRHPPGARVFRLAVLALLVVLAIVRLH